jgi:CO/xanthine dehydrogenase FAD-binding subunit
MPTLRELTEYHKPATLDEALKLLRRTRIKTVPLAGGTSLVPEAARDVQAVVDLNALDLSFIKTSEVSGDRRGLEIGATTKLQALADHEAVHAYADRVLVTAILDSASRHVREAASLAGSIVAAPGNTPHQLARKHPANRDRHSQDVDELEDQIPVHCRSFFMCASGIAVPSGTGWSKRLVAS